MIARALAIFLLSTQIGCATRHVRGQVLDHQGKPLYGATVILADEVAHTNREGFYELDRLSLKEGQYVVFVTHDEHIFVRTSQRIAGKKAILSPIQMEVISIEVPYPEIPLESMIGD